MSPAVIALWADAMNAAARSQPKTVRLLLSCPPGRHREELLAQFAAHGIAADRVELLAQMSYSDYLAAYHRIDIALDPFPHNGATTTLDALHMGVPVLSLAGKTPAGRLGESILTTAGLADWIARSGEEFVMHAALRTRDLATLASLRTALRARLMNSPLTHASHFTSNFEAALTTRVSEPAKQNP
jgi:predicted O-linked N-acetylglucosamine transferase (SPINDLY family)